jgi:hypothetical protein
MRHVEIVDISALATQKARVLGPGHRLADAETGGLNVGHWASWFCV